MGNKIATEEDYWMCTGGIMPAQMQSIQRIAEQQDSKKYLIKNDTATASLGDFVCKWIMLIMALIAAVIAVLIVATGGAALGVLVAVGAAAGAAGAAFGSVIGGLVCGQKAALARTWIGPKSNLMIGGQTTLTTGSIMQCPVFGSQIVHAPNVKTWWDALRVGIGNFGETVILGALGGALIGVGGAVLSGAAALSLPTLASVGTNLVGSVTGWGMAARLYFGANAVSNQQALGTIDINNPEERDAAFGNAAFPEYGSVKRIASGSAEPMDAMLLLYFLNLRVPGAKPGVSPKEEPVAGNKEEPVAAKEEPAKPKEEEVKPVENKNTEPEGTAKDKKGKAYEKTLAELIAQRRQMATDFYMKHNPALTERQIKSHLNGIDFTKPLEIISIPPDGLGPKGNELYQFTKVNTKGDVLRGEYYSNNPKNTPNELGVSEKYNLRDPDNEWQHSDQIGTVKQENIIFDETKQVEGLRSTSAEINDTWSLKDEAVHTTGGGSQIYIPKGQ